jgi:hypothetical protein
MTQEQAVDLTIMDAQEWNETDQKIAQIKNILKEEWLEDDPDLMDAFDEAVKHAVKGEIVSE